MYFGWHRGVSREGDKCGNGTLRAAAILPRTRKRSGFLAGRNAKKGIAEAGNRATSSREANLTLRCRMVNSLRNALDLH